MLKNLLISIFLFSFTHAGNETIQFHNIQGDTISHIQVANYKWSEATEQDWLAIYKKESSNEWSNVISWTYLDVLKGEAPFDTNSKVWTNATKGLPIGEYEARFFRNNSYAVEASLAFTIATETPFLRVQGNYDADKHRSVNYIFYMPSYTNARETQPDRGEQLDWVGLYKVGDANDWENVKKWAWVKDLPITPINGGYPHKQWSFSTLDIEQDAGEYEIRYFLNNSYETYVKSRVLNITPSENTPLKTITLGEMLPINEERANLEVTYTNITPRYAKDWIALVKGDTQEYQHENIVAWQYLEDSNPDGSVTFEVNPTQWVGETLKAVIYADDGYEIVAEGSHSY